MTRLHLQWPLELTDSAKAVAPHVSPLASLHGSEAVGTEVRGVDFRLHCYTGTILLFSLLVDFVDLFDYLTLWRAQKD